MSKYRAKRKVVDGQQFDSQREANRWLDLRLLERGGLIHELERPGRYPLYAVNAKSGELIQVATYKPDFSYREGPERTLVIEDSKGHQTQQFRLRKRMFEAQYGIEVRLT